MHKGNTIQKKMTKGFYSQNDMLNIVLKVRESQKEILVSSILPKTERII